MRDAAWLEPLRRELDAATEPRTFYFRDDDAGWASDRLVPLLDLFAEYAMPLDLAVIPAALDQHLASILRRRAEAQEGLSFHQHGYCHANHQRAGRPSEFGPERHELAQRRDIETGARRLRALLGETAPIFTPPWNRCTPATGRCLVDLGFRALARDSAANPLALSGLQELEVHVDWCRAEPGETLLSHVRMRRSTGVMLHHAHIGADELEQIEDLLVLLSSHRNAWCVPLSSLVSGDYSQAPSSAPISTSATSW